MQIQKITTKPNLSTSTIPQFLELIPKLTRSCCSCKVKIANVHPIVAQILIQVIHFVFVSPTIVHPIQEGISIAVGPILQAEVVVRFHDQRKDSVVCK